jgi:hypothetical protein
MNHFFKQLLAAGALAVAFGTTACSSLEASTVSGDDMSQSPNDITQQLASDSQGA